MKSKIKSWMTVIVFFGSFTGLIAQNKPKPVAAVLGISSKGLIQDQGSITYMVQLELEKTGVYDVMDQYDIEDVLKKNQIDVNTCQGKSCLVNAGTLLKADKMVTGSVDRFEEKIVISLKVIDVKTGSEEKQDVTEYLNLQPDLQKTIRISVEKLVGITPDPQLVNMLINYDRPIDSPNTHIRLNGPRMGAAVVLGDAGKVLRAKQSEGGFNMFPLMFQIGWQQEWQYLSAGNFQALVEVIPTISGLESGKFIPSVTVMNGFRFGKGWEFAIGPSFRIVKESYGFFDSDENWHLQGETNLSNYPYQWRIDSRGKPKFTTHLIIGVGKTFKSGYLNIPFNIYVAPDKQGTFVGFSFGFNIYRKPKIQ